MFYEGRLVTEPTAPIPERHATVVGKKSSQTRCTPTKSAYPICKWIAPHADTSANAAQTRSCLLGVPPWHLYSVWSHRVAKDIPDHHTPGRNIALIATFISIGTARHWSPILTPELALCRVLLLGKHFLKPNRYSSSFSVRDLSTRA